MSCVRSHTTSEILCVLIEVETQVGNVCSVLSKQQGSDMPVCMVAKAWLPMERGMKLYVQCVEPPYQGGTEEEEE
jgi:hypothetical protein